MRVVGVYYSPTSINSLIVEFLSTFWHRAQCAAPTLRPQCVCVQRVVGVAECCCGAVSGRFLGLTSIRLWSQ